MNKPLHIIYVTGLGDVQKPRGQLWAIHRWNKKNVNSELFQVKWGDKEPWPPKFERLLRRIDELVADGQSVGLVGTSAGASAVINAFAARKDKIVGVVCIAGKVNRSEAIHPIHLEINPAFVSSVKECRYALQKLDKADRKKILSRYGLFDEIVKSADSIIPGAKNRISPTLGHFITIATQITFGSPSLIRFLERQSNPG